VKKQYETIGGSPIRKWTEYQGKEMCKILDKACPESAPHKAYTAFRYADPLTEEALEEMKEDGVEHAIAFSQFPQWSCTTSGSSMNELWREVRRLNMTDTFRWSVIDRWPVHDGFVNAVVERIEERMSDFEVDDPNKVVVLFSAHSVPMKVVERGDHYVPEVAATVKKVMERWNKTNKYILGWQSKVGYVPWMVPSTEHIIKSLGKRGVRRVLVVPIAFTSDHIETLFEIGEEYAELAEEVGIKEFRFTEGLNGSETFISALADIVQDHIESKTNCSSQYKMKCVTCVKPLCRKILNPAYPKAIPAEI
jgi:ferrochelatase